LVKDRENETAEELCEGVIHDLLESNMIVRCCNGKSSILNKFRILPAVLHLLESYVFNKNREHCGFFYRQFFDREFVKNGLRLEQKKVTLDHSYFG